MISGNWRPINALFIALLFGASEALGVRLQLGDVNQLQTLMVVAGWGLFIVAAIWALSRYRSDRTVIPWVQIISAAVGLLLVLTTYVAQIPDTTIPFQFLGLPPYILTIIVVAGLVGSVRPPAAEGKVYEKQ
ncbi:MAG: hypothetical protein M5R40_04175 [Anaerolineae bacterium]|nr:hypothetical protein [Anaerolineae bacterium]